MIVKALMYTYMAFMVLMGVVMAFFALALIWTILWPLILAEIAVILIYIGYIYFRAPRDPLRT